MLNKQSTNFPADSSLRREGRNHSWLCWCIRLAKDSGQIPWLLRLGNGSLQEVSGVKICTAFVYCTVAPHVPPKKHQHKRRWEVPGGCLLWALCTIETSFGTFKMTMLSTTSGWKKWRTVCPEACTLLFCSKMGHLVPHMRHGFPSLLCAVPAMLGILSWTINTALLMGGNSPLSRRK